MHVEHVACPFNTKEISSTFLFFNRERNKKEGSSVVIVAER